MSLYFFGTIAVLLLLFVARLTRDALALRLLPESGRLPAGPRPRVSVVVAARDEEARIETAVRRLLGQDGVELEIVAVDDRSTDRTGELLRRVAADDPRLKVLRVDELPEGWLGKCHACHAGAAQAAGDWVLFADGDIWMKPDVVARAVAAAEAEGADHVCLLFGQSGGTAAGKACHLVALMSISKHATRTGPGRPTGYLGIGAFNLVRAAAYRKAGGHVPLRLTVCDDHLLGLLLRRSGAVTRGYLAPDVEADWFATPLGLVKALEKNSFAAVRYRLRTVLLAVPLYLVMWGGAVIGPWTLTPAAVLASKLRVSRGYALLVPFVIPVFALVMANSAFRTLRQGGVRWRDTFYPLELLRAGNYQ
jgi:glycosyltransferase involved in cell wall biosynthesis